MLRPGSRGSCRGQRPALIPLLLLLWLPCPHCSPSSIIIPLCLHWGAVLQVPPREAFPRAHPRPRPPRLLAPVKPGHLLWPGSHPGPGRLSQEPPKSTGVVQEARLLQRTRRPVPTQHPPSRGPDPRGAEAGAAVGVGVGVGHRESQPSSRASCDWPPRVQTPGPHPTPGREIREEPAHPKTGAKVRRKLPLTSPGSHPGPGLGAPGHTHGSPSVLLGSVTMTPVPEAEPGWACSPLQREARSRTAGLGQPGGGAPAEGIGPWGSLGLGGGEASPGHHAALLTSGPTLLIGGPERAQLCGQQAGMKQACPGSCPGQSFPPGPRGQALAAHPTSCGQDHLELLGSQAPRCLGPPD